MSAERLYQVAVALHSAHHLLLRRPARTQSVPANPNSPPANDRDLIAADVLSHTETLELIRAYYKLSERPRRRLLDLAVALQRKAPPTPPEARPARTARPLSFRARQSNRPRRLRAIHSAHDRPRHPAPARLRRYAGRRRAHRDPAVPFARRHASIENKKADGFDPVTEG